MVIITGQVNSWLLGRDVFQEADITGACESFTKHSYLVKDAKDLPRVFKEAFHIASTGRPGPVLIDVPTDIQLQEVGEWEYPEKAEIRGYKPRTQGHALQIKKALAAIKEAKRPIICCGGGVVLANAREEMTAFAKKSGIPVCATIDGDRRHADGFRLLYGHDRHVRPARAPTRRCSRRTSSSCAARASVTARSMCPSRLPSRRTSSTSTSTRPKSARICPSISRLSAISARC